MIAPRRVLFALFLVLLAGCSSRTGSGAAPEQTELQEVNELLHAAAGGAGRPPARLADLDRYQSMYPNAYGAVKSGKVVVLWATPLKGEGDVGKDETILAYEQEVPASGGYVLLTAGTVKKMSAGEFAAAPKGN